MLALIVTPALAQLRALQPTAAASGADQPDLGRYVLICLLLIALIAALGVGFKKLVAGTLVRRAAERALGVVDVLPLGGRKSIAVVRCYDRTFVLGLSDKEIHSIAELDRAEPPRPAAPASAPRRAPAEEFASILRELRPRAAAPTSASVARSARLGGGEGLLG